MFALWHHCPSVSPDSRLVIFDSYPVNFTSLCLSNLFLPACSQYCHLLPLPPTLPVSPFPIHFIYFQGKTPLRNLQRLLIASGVMSKHLTLATSKAFQDSTHLPLSPLSCRQFSWSALIRLLPPL